jgi:hypothetical protein
MRHFPASCLLQKTDLQHQALDLVRVAFDVLGVAIDPLFLPFQAGESFRRVGPALIEHRHGRLGSTTARPNIAAAYSLIARRPRLDSNALN